VRIPSRILSTARKIDRPARSIRNTFYPRLYPDSPIYGHCFPNIAMVFCSFVRSLVPVPPDTSNGVAESIYVGLVLEFVLKWFRQRRVCRRRRLSMLVRGKGPAFEMVDANDNVYAGQSYSNRTTIKPDETAGTCGPLEILHSGLYCISLLE